MIRRLEHQRNFFALGNEIVNDPEISWKAKGVLVYLLSKPHDWKVYQEDIVNHGTDGASAVRSAINELIKAGYITRYREYKDGKIANWVYEVSENKKRMENQRFKYEEEQGSENLDLENLNQEKDTLQKTDITKDSNTYYSSLFNNILDNNINNIINSFTSDDVLRQDLVNFFSGQLESKAKRKITEAYVKSNLQDLDTYCNTLESQQFFVRSATSAGRNEIIPFFEKQKLEEARQQKLKLERELEQQRATFSFNPEDYDTTESF